MWLAIPCSSVLVDDSFKARKKEGGSVSGTELAHRPDVSKALLRKGAYGRHLALTLWDRRDILIPSGEPKHLV